MVAQMPRVRELRLLWGRQFETDAPRYYLTIEHSYDSLEDIERALASDVRTRMREKLNMIMPLFKGRILHVNYEITPVAVCQ